MVLLCYNPQVGREELPLFFPPPSIPLFPVYLGHSAMTRGSWLTGRFGGATDSMPYLFNRIGQPKPIDSLLPIVAYIHQGNRQRSGERRN